MKFRLQAALINVLISAVFLGLLAVLVCSFWYPTPYWEILAVGELAAIIAMVHLLGGPLVIFSISKADKPELKTDWLIIGVLQLGALVFSSWHLFDNRPYYMVFAVDRFEVLRQHEVVFPDNVDSDVYIKPLIGPVLAVASIPADKKAYQELLQETLFAGGDDIERRPEFWSLYAGNFVLATSTLNSVDQLILSKPGIGEALVEKLDPEVLSSRDLVYAPVVGKRQDFALVIDKATGEILAALRLNSW